MKKKSFLGENQLNELRMIKLPRDLTFYAKCPECGGEMQSVMKRKTCETCGLSLSGGEYDDLWRKNRDASFKESDRSKKKRHEEYEDFWRDHKK